MTHSEIYKRAAEILASGEKAWCQRAMMLDANGAKTWNEREALRRLFEISQFIAYAAMRAAESE